MGNNNKSTTEKEPLLQPFSPIDIIIAIGLTTVILIQAFTVGTVSETIIGGLVGYMGANRSMISRLSNKQSGGGDTINHNQYASNNYEETHHYGENKTEGPIVQETEGQSKSIFDKLKKQ